MLKPKETIKYWKKKAWKEFSWFIRNRGSFDGYNNCCTCGANHEVKRLQGGHFVPGRHPIILFDERNCHPQCYNCNVNLKGNPRKYDLFMKKRYGQEVIDELDKLDGKTTDKKWFDYKEIYEKYKKINEGVEDDCCGKTGWEDL